MARAFGFALYAEGEGAQASVLSAFVTALQAIPGRIESAPAALPPPAAGQEVIQEDSAATEPEPELICNRPATIGEAAKPKTPAEPHTNEQIDDVGLAFLRAISTTDGKPSSIKAVTGKQDVGYHMRKLKDEGLIVSVGATSQIRYQLTPKGQKVIGDKAEANGKGSTRVQPSSTAPAWTLEQRRMLRLLKERGGSAPIATVRDELQWSENLFERAADRPDFTIKGNTVALSL